MNRCGILFFFAAYCSVCLGWNFGSWNASSQHLRSEAHNLSSSSPNYEVSTQGDCRSGYFRCACPAPLPCYSFQCPTCCCQNTRSPTKSPSGPVRYTYSISDARFKGKDTKGKSLSLSACSGKKGSCRNNIDCQCSNGIGPIPVGNYEIGPATTFKYKDKDGKDKEMEHCFRLTPTFTPCGQGSPRGGFWIHGGNCGSDVSKGCIIIDTVTTRKKIVPNSVLDVWY